MRHFIYIISICFTVFLMSSCQKTELDDLKPMKVNAEERVDEANSIVTGKGDNKDSGEDDNGGGLPPADQDDNITDDDDEDDDDEMEGGRVTENN